MDIHQLRKLAGLPTLKEGAPAAVKKIPTASATVLKYIFVGYDDVGMDIVEDLLKMHGYKLLASWDSGSDAYVDLGVPENKLDKLSHFSNGFEIWGHSGASLDEAKQLYLQHGEKIVFTVGE